jgi:3-mercaptopyruvate sulfurtransferase SseA
MNIKSAEHELTERTKRFVKAELKRADVTYEQLAARLREMGHDETKVSVANKLSRGTFSATFFIAVMKAIGREQVDLAGV